MVQIAINIKYINSSLIVGEMRAIGSNWFKSVELGNGL